MRDCEQMNRSGRDATAEALRVALLLSFLGTVLMISTVAGAETPGEHFEKAMKRLAENCAKAKLRPGDTGCDILKLKPADPLATEEGRFAHSIKIPNPVQEDSGYKPGMAPEQYFDLLCKTEAGEFIYKTVENVEGLYMMRPRKEATDYDFEHLYALEDPYGHTNGEANDFEFLFVEPNRYGFVEMPLSLWRKPSWGKQFLDQSYTKTPHPDAKYERYSGHDSRNPNSMVKEYTAVFKSHYGFTWRGIPRWSRQ